MTDSPKQHGGATLHGARIHSEPQRRRRCTIIFIKNPHIRFSTSGSRDLPHSPLNAFSFEKKQLTTQPRVSQHPQAKGELTTRCKTNGKIIPLSTTHYKNARLPPPIGMFSHIFHQAKKRQKGKSWHL